MPTAADSTWEHEHRRRHIPIINLDTKAHQGQWALCVGRIGALQSMPPGGLWGAHMRDRGHVALHDAREHALHPGGIGQLRVRGPREWKVACTRVRMQRVKAEQHLSLSMPMGSQTMIAVASCVATHPWAKALTNDSSSHRSQETAHSAGPAVSAHLSAAQTG